MSYSPSVEGSPLDVRFSYAALNPREDQTEPRALFVDRQAVFPLSGYPEFGSSDRALGCSYKYSDRLFGVAAAQNATEARDLVGMMIVHGIFRKPFA